MESRSKISNESFGKNFILSRVPAIYNLTDLVLIKAYTNLHVGCGQSGGLVDLPIQRDEFGYPCIWSSSIKGALKTSLLHAFMSKHGNYQKAKKAVYALLGPDPEEGETFESSIAVLDAYLLAIPVRSLKGVYAYVTSPILLKRFLDRIELCFKFKQEGSKPDNLEEAQNVVGELIKEAENLGKDSVICVGNCDEVIIDQPKSLQGTILLAEEFLLKVTKMIQPKTNEQKSENRSQETRKSEKQGEVENICKNSIKCFLGIFEFDKPLLVLHDDVARSVINRSLVRLTRVSLGRGTKTVKTGPWTEEYVPIKTIFYTLFLYKRPSLTTNFIKMVLEKEDISSINDDIYLQALEKLSLLKKDNAKKLREMLRSSPDRSDLQNVLVEGTREIFWERIDNGLQGFIIIGGKETIGKGIVKLKLLCAKEEKSDVGSR